MFRLMARNNSTQKTHFILVKRKRSSEKQCADFAQEQHL
jgi:hypothetical protein